MGNEEEVSGSRFQVPDKKPETFDLGLETILHIP
jgi:hypothetical protein